MKVKVINGNQIGGCITLIESNSGTKICIDIGENLPDTKGDKKPEISIDGLTGGKPDFDAVFITHYHGDHIGKYDKILKDIPIYIGEISKEIYKILQERLVSAKIIPKENLKIIEDFKTYNIHKKIEIKDIIITPIEVDHSAFNSYMLLIEADGKRILHTGDFRLHGQRGKAVIPALERYVGEVDLLICEGTTLSRKGKKPMTERDLQIEVEKLFNENKYSFVMCSSTNIDRIAAIHKAAIKNNRIFVCDKYQKKILNYIDSVTRSGLYKFKGKVLSYDDNIYELMKNRGFVMLVRDNYISKKVIEKFPENIFVYSQWKGYLNEGFKEYENLQKFVPKDYIHIHTSGHADFEAIEKVCETVKPKILIPIHGENPESFCDMGIENCEIKILNNAEEIII